MKTHYAASQLAGLPGMPGHASSVLNKAKRENWRSKKRSGLGGGRVFSITSLPEETRAALAAQTLKDAAETAVIAKKPLNKSAIAHALRELETIQQRQMLLLEESGRLLQSALVALNQEQGQ